MRRKGIGLRKQISFHRHRLLVHSSDEVHGLGGRPQKIFFGPKALFFPFLRYLFNRQALGNSELVQVDLAGSELPDDVNDRQVGIEHVFSRLQFVVSA